MPENVNQEEGREIEMTETGEIEEVDLLEVDPLEEETGPPGEVDPQEDTAMTRGTTKKGDMIGMTAEVEIETEEDLEIEIEITTEETEGGQDQDPVQGPIHDRQLHLEAEESEDREVVILSLKM